jgi:hypothetical protein
MARQIENTYHITFPCFRAVRPATEQGVYLVYEDNARCKAVRKFLLGYQNHALDALGRRGKLTNTAATVFSDSPTHIL